MTINELVTQNRDFDGVYFCKPEDTEDTFDGWSLTFLSLNNKRDKKFEECDAGVKYQILFHKDNKIEMFEAILGDPSAYLKNLLQSDQEGMIIKKCKASKKILSQLIGKKNFRDFEAELNSE